jgi:glucokinase
MSLGLVGDIGGTNARFGLVDLDDPGRRVVRAQTLLCRDYPRAIDAIAAYLDGETPSLAVIAVAGPVTDGAIRFTNNDWSLSEAELRGLGCSAARLINDYAAQALAAPTLAGDDLRTLGDTQAAEAGATLVVLGPGTGFGVGALARDGGREIALATEGGHVGLAPGDPLEAEVLDRLARRYGRVSIERVLSGPGLCALHAALGDIDGVAQTIDDPAEITRLAEAGDPACGRTLDRFCAMLGGAAGDFALAYGAKGGVFLGGGIAPRIVERLASGGFRARFEAKGRFAAYMRAIPTQVILRPHAALHGAARALLSLQESR